ncbi:MAG: outer membrane lipoprotein carrier protein LolA [Bdellovibrionota bacterium]
MKCALALILLMNFFGPRAVAQAPVKASKPIEKAPDKAADEISAQSELVLKSLSERYEKLRNWKAKFTHNNMSTALGTTKFSEGDFVFSYPDRFRFSLNGPSEFSDFVSDGKQAWYVKYPKGRKSAAVVQQFSNVKNLDLDKYLFLLKGLPTYTPQTRATLLKSFKITSRVTDKELTLVLEPKRSEDLVKVELSFEQLKDYPSTALIADSLGGESTVKISDVVRLQKISADEFVPKYPKDSRVEKVGN